MIHLKVRQTRRGGLIEGVIALKWLDSLHQSTLAILQQQRTTITVIFKGSALRQTRSVFFVTSTIKDVNNSWKPASALEHPQQQHCPWYQQQPFDNVG